MKRQELKAKDRWEYVSSRLVNSDYPIYNEEHELELAFDEGAQWADAHPHWISVDDEMPKDGECVATINTVGVKDVRHYSHGKWYSNFGNEYDDITHWMRLPAEPKKGGAQ